MWCFLFGILFAPILALNIPSSKNFSWSKENSRLFTKFYLNTLGPYDPVWKNYELCKGPKFKNVSETDVVVFQQGKDYYGTFKFKFLTRSLVDEIRLWLYSIVGETRKQLWSHKLSDPCKNFVFAELIQEQLNSTKCIVEKTSYNKTVNFTETTRKLLGTSFFYGNYSMKVVMSSKNANILCLLLHIELLNKSKLNK
ncbi:unnamed protein product [Pieris brassicae]|uniref:Group i salivary lipocalin n=1 Tax=Pieris brassicae TaxID=7116 RepID=A0A9P0TG47_PIEBR|nr:unnamed protein product [Pieris brassicae]